MLPTLFNATCTINRSQAVGTNGRSQMQQLYTGVGCMVMPMNHTTTLELHFSIGRAYDIFFSAGQDVQPGDQLVSGGNTYTVKAVQPYNVPVVGYTQAICEQEID